MLLLKSQSRAKKVSINYILEYIYTLQKKSECIKNIEWKHII